MTSDPPSDPPSDLPSELPSSAARYSPGGVRVLAVGWWLLSAVLAGDLLRQGEPGPGLGVGLAVLAFGCAVVHALFWQPSVGVDDDGVELVNVLRRVRLAWASVEDVDTRWALTVRAGGRRWTSWAAPASGRRMRPVSRRETPWADPGAEGIAGSRAPGSSSGEAAVLVGSRWQTWKDSPFVGSDVGRGPEAAGGDEPRVRWNRPVVLSLAVSGGVVLVALLVLSLG